MNEVDKRFDEKYLNEQFGDERTANIYALLKKELIKDIHSEIRRALEGVVPEKMPDRKDIPRSAIGRFYPTSKEDDEKYDERIKWFNQAIDKMNSNIKEYLGGGE